MKKLLSIALTLVLALGLVSPALAAEETDPVQLLEELGILDATPPEIDPDYTYSDPYAEYTAAHPDEIAALDVDQLLDDWGYYDRTAAEWFLDDTWYDEDAPLEDAVKWHYIENRLRVAEDLAEAEVYKAQFPDAWATFDADSFFAYEYSYYGSKDQYMAEKNILTNEEFAGVMFKECAEHLDWYGYEPNWWVRPDPVEPDEPTLNLYVNGEVVEDNITAKNGVTYADAADLRAIFGDQIVPADQTGPLPIRSTAEAAGWEVQWYDDRFWTGNQEVQLWDKAAFEAELSDQFGPLNDFFTQALETSGSALFSDTPVTTHQTVTADLTRFSTLDGDETYSMTFDVDMTMGSGVLDATLTFDVTELLQMFPADALESLTQLGGFSLIQLRQLLKAGVMEFIVDYNTGDIAYNAPLLVLFDESLAGWQTEYISGLDGMAEAMESLEEFSFTSTLYAQLLSTASYMGAEYALGEYDQTVALLSTFGGKDRFATQNGKTTYILTAQDMNEAISALINEDAENETDEVYPIFKFFDVTYALDDKGNVSSSLHIRPDMDGLATSIAKAYENSYYGGDSDYGVMAIVMNWLLKGWDMDLTATSQGSAQRSTGTVDVHWNNVGTLSVRTTATQTAGKAPRTVEDVTK